MRKVLFSLLLATTMATPALAADWPGHGGRSGDRDQARSERSDSRPERSESRQDHSDGRQAAEARQARAEAQQARAQVQQERMQVRDQSVQNRGDHIAQGAAAAQMQEANREAQVRRNRQANVNERGRPTLGERNGSNSVANWSGQRGGRNATANWSGQRGERDTASNWNGQRRGGVRAPAGARPDRPAPLPQTAYSRNHRAPNWDRNWRNDRGHDWRDYRNRHRSTFHLGLYLDPFGWGYQRYNIGWRLWPNYYSSNYWLNDPSMYALPYAPFPYKWVRYYNDALLVNTYTGQVEDVMYDFFW